MTLKKSATLKKAELDQLETTISTAPVLRIYNGTAPTDPDTALSGNTLLATGTLPSDWMAAAGNAGNVATKAKTGTWTLTGQSGAGAGTAGTFFRIWDAAVSNCHLQGTVGATGSGADMTLDNNSIADTQTITVSTFTITAGN